MTTSRLLNILSFILTLLFLTSCFPTNTSDANETYKYWTGTDAPKDLKLYNGQYWQSPHFTKECVFYLNFMPTKTWWDEMMKINSILKDSADWTKPIDAPNWFKPDYRFIRYKRSDDFDQGSRYFRDTISGICYIYEIQL